MKKMFIVAFCCLMTLCVTAQEKLFDLGVRAGWNKTKIKVEDFKTDSKGGYNAGVFARLNFDKWYIEPGVNWTRKYVNVQRSTSDTKLRNFSIDIPVMFGANVFKMQQFKARVFVGPSASLLYEDMEIFDKNGKQLKADNMMFYGRGGVGVDYWKVTFDFYYEYGLKKFGDGIKSPETFGFILGFKIL